LRWSSGCQLGADPRDATPSSRPSPSLRWTASSERWTPSDWNAGRDQIRTPDAITSERLDGFHWNLQHRTKLHSTNPLERLNKEVKRRADVVGIFPNEASIIRLIGAVLLEQNDEWQLQHRYMQVEAMAELTAPVSEAETRQIAA
jgi:transposase-like protein